MGIVESCRWRVTGDALLWRDRITNAREMRATVLQTLGLVRLDTRVTDEQWRDFALRYEPDPVKREAAMQKFLVRKRSKKEVAA